MIHFGLTIEAYAEGMASFARWPEQRQAVLARLAISEARWEQAAAAFRDAMVGEADQGRDDLAARFRAAFEAARARLEREQPDVGALAPLRLVDPEPRAPLAPSTATREVDDASVREALRKAAPLGHPLPASAGSAKRAPEPAATGTVELRPAGPFVPGALPFAEVTDEDIEGYALLTSDLEAFPDRRADVLVKHHVGAPGTLEAVTSRWTARFDKDVRTRQHWEALHQSFLGFITRQRNRGREPCL